MPMVGKVVVGMSGGVDSSVTALLLLEQGYAVTGLFMKNWEEDDHTGLCTAHRDHADALAVCECLDIPLKTVNFAAEYWDNVFEIFLAEYGAGRTPNPDILCNKYIKFRAFLDYAMDLGGELIATGHYARINESAGHYRMLKGLDPGKDQTYFLYTLGQEALSRTLFPIGHLEKSEVRALAVKTGFVNATKKGSTGICFIGERRFREFLQRYLSATPGDMQTPEGEVIGRHQGLIYYTLGQRQGLNIGGRRGASAKPWYALEKDLARNILIVGQGHDHPRLFHNGLEAGQLGWVSGAPSSQHIRCTAKTRYRQSDQPCSMTMLDEGRCHVTFDQPQRAITPGQSVVFYQGEECLGGGVIEGAIIAP